MEGTGETRQEAFGSMVAAFVTPQARPGSTLTPGFLSSLDALAGTRGRSCHSQQRLIGSSPAALRAGY